MSVTRWDCKKKQKAVHSSAEGTAFCFLHIFSSLIVLIEDKNDKNPVNK